MHPCTQWKSHWCISIALPNIKVLVPECGFPLNCYCTEVKFTITLFVLLIINLAKYQHLCSLMSLKVHLLVSTVLFLIKRKELSLVAWEWFILQCPGTFWSKEGPQKLSGALHKPKPFNAKQHFSVSTCHKMMVGTQQYKELQSFAFWVRDNELDAFSASRQNLLELSSCLIRQTPLLWHRQQTFP